MEQLTPQPDRRETLLANFDAAEAGTLEPLAEPTASERARDDAGRFAKQEAAKVEAAKAEAPAAAPAQWAGPSTWKAEYRPLWDALAAGQPLTPEQSKQLAQYNHERENQFKSGVSTYRQEALTARDLNEAMAPILPELQRYGTTPKEWLGEVYRAQKTLADGTPEQKYQLWMSMAARYGIPTNGMQQQNQDPVVAALRAEIEGMKREVGSVKTWRSQLDSQALQAEVERVSGNPEKYPHFEQLREPMAQYLESGAAKDLDTAYKMALRMSDDLFEQTVTQRLQAQKPTAQQVASQAKAKAVSPKSATPSGAVAAKTDAKDRRSLLSDKFDEASAGRL